MMCHTAISAPNCIVYLKLAVSSCFSLFYTFHFHVAVVVVVVELLLMVVAVVEAVVMSVMPAFSFA